MRVVLSQYRFGPQLVSVGAPSKGEGTHASPTTVANKSSTESVIIIIDNFCIALFSGVPKLTALYNILQHFVSFTNIMHIIMTTNNV